jgi:hypothetical protein
MVRKGINMDYRDFNILSQVDLYDLKVGDYFMEDTYPDVFRIDEIVVEDKGFTTINLQTVYKTFNITENETCDWFYDRGSPAYAPTLLKLKEKN